MECPSCKFVAAPGQAAVDGACPNCERPYRDQPTPLNSDMAMRNMPAPGEADSGGNPLQEGILGGQDGGWAHRNKRDESFASVQSAKDDIEPDIEIPAEIVDVLPPDPDSLRPDKKRMDKQADLLGEIGDFGADVALPVAGGTAGFLVGGPAGAAAGAALGAGAGNLAQGDDLGEAALGAAPYAIGGGIGGMGAKMMAGGAAQAAAAGSTRGGIGSLMKSAWGKIPTGKIRDAYLMNSVMNDAGGAAGGMAAPAPQMAAPAPVQAPSFYSRTAAPNSTPSSQDHIPSNDTSDPESVDFKERDDGSRTKGLHSDQGVNDMGGTDTGPDGLFASDSPSLSSLAELLPKVLEYALSDQTAAGDPDMENLHQMLESEHPGYMNDADDDHGTKLMVTIMKGKPQGDDDNLLQDNDEPHDPIAEHQATALRPGLETTCRRCGGVVDASVGNCPQCGMGNGDHRPQPTNPDFTTPQQMIVPQPQPSTQPIMAGVGDSQGPNTDEQKAMVAELLQQEGRGDEIPNMILNPFDYADELTQITGGDTPPEDVGQPGPPPPVDPSQQGSMPMPGMAAPGPGGAGAGPMMAAIAKYAGTVDGVADKCPNCDSHSTGYTDLESGKCGCKTCNHHWDADPLVQVTSAEGDANPLAVPMVEEEQLDDPQQEQDSSHSWMDSDGSPLQVGQSYEMYSANYEIPDRIRIDAVKPDVIEYTMIGEYGLDHRTELTHEEASIENINFIPAGHQDDTGIDTGQGDLEQNMDDDPRPAPGQDTDASTPHMQMASVIAAHKGSVEETGPDWLMEGVPHTSGAKMTPYEQRGYIEEDGMARNSDKLDLGGTHYEHDDLDASLLFSI